MLWRNSGNSFHNLPRESTRGHICYGNISAGKYYLCFKTWIYTFSHEIVLQVKLNVSLLEDIKDDMEFSVKLAKEESVLVLPGKTKSSTSSRLFAYADWKNCCRDSCRNEKLAPHNHRCRFCNSWRCPWKNKSLLSQACQEAINPYEIVRFFSVWVRVFCLFCLESWLFTKWCEVPALSFPFNKLFRSYYKTSVSMWRLQWLPSFVHISLKPFPCWWKNAWE